MKAAFFTLCISLILFSSCITINESPTKGDGQYVAEDRYFADEDYDKTFEEASFNENLDFKSAALSHKTKRSSGDEIQNNGWKTHQFTDARTGLVVSSSEYPSNWKVISKPTYTLDQKLPVFLIQTTGPNNLKSFNTPFKIHVSYQNPQTYQLMRNSFAGKLHREMASNQQILKEEVVPRMQKSGFRFVKNIRLSKTENYLKTKLGAENNGQLQMAFTATVWENDEGLKALATVGKFYAQQPLSFIDTMTLWMYSTDYTFVDSEHFDETIAVFENALVNSKENPQWAQYVAQLGQQRAREAAEKARLGRIDRQRAYQAHQRKMKGIWAAQDANHASFMNRNFGSGSSTSQRNFVNMINEEETVYNPLNGQNYQVNAHSTQNWMDSSGNLIQNDDLFYTPNGDINLNNREWTKVGSNY